MTTPHRTLREAAQMALDALLTGYHQGTQDGIAALREALAAPEPEPVALESVHLTRDTRGMCVVRVNGRVAIRDNGDIIDHMATLEWFAAPPAPQANPDMDSDDVLWLWKDGEHFLAYRHLYPCYSPGGDPMTLGEPFGKAIFRHSHDRSTPPGAAPPAAPAPVVPIDMVLHCPACGLQHIDAPDERTPDWKNEPHRSHLCHGCGHIWRPADVPTNGVAAVATKGKADSPIAAPVVRELQDDLIESVIRDVAELDYSSLPDMPEVMLVTANELRGILQAHGITGGKP